jgi:hypothetical protein
VSIAQTIDQIWSQFLDVLAKVVSPDWGALVGLLPLFLLIGVIGPGITVLALIWVYYFLRKPRTKIHFVDGPRPALIAADGLPLFPVGEPYDPQSGLVYPPGTVEDETGKALSVTCPMCGVARLASATTCTNCGLVLKLDPRVAVRTLQPSGPPPGGAAAA